MRNILLRLLFLVLLVSVLIGGAFALFAFRESRGTKVVFLNVGQGDAILISQGGNQILIDGGRSGKTLLTALSRHIPFWDRTIESVIATHPDADHIGGLSSLFERYAVGTFYTNGGVSDTEIWKLLESSIGTRPPLVERGVVGAGAVFSFPTEGTLSVIYPLAGFIPPTTNEGSVVSRFSFGETDFLLTGDLPKEEAVLRGNVSAEVLKLAHHGSKHSSSEAFLSMVRPEEVVISVGKNSYGHPAPEVLSHITVSGVEVRRTDTSGDIVYRCLSETNRCVFVP